MAVFSFILLGYLSLSEWLMEFHAAVFIEPDLAIGDFDSCRGGSFDREKTGIISLISHEPNVTTLSADALDPYAR